MVFPMLMPAVVQKLSLDNNDLRFDAHGAQLSFEEASDTHNSSGHQVLNKGSLNKKGNLFYF